MNKTDILKEIDRVFKADNDLKSLAILMALQKNLIDDITIHSDTTTLIDEEIDWYEGELEECIKNNNYINSNVAIEIIKLTITRLKALRERTK